MSKGITPWAQLEHITPDAEFLLERAMRVCYNSFDKCDGTLECAQRLIRKVIGMWHLDTLEHATASFRVLCSRACMSQFTRHRHASFGVQSQRYVRYNQSLYIEPPNHPNIERFRRSMDRAFMAYSADLSDGVRKEDARLHLPEAWVTEFIVTMNFRAWRHFLSLRRDKAAQWEIRGIAEMIYGVLLNRAPSCFQDLQSIPEDAPPE